MKMLLHLLNSLFLKYFPSQISKERFFLISIITLLVIIWFRQGLMLGSGESGLPFYNPQKLLGLSMHIWSDTPLGDTSAVGYASVPFYAIVSFFLGLNMPSFLIQAIIYWLILVMGVLSIHKLAALVTEDNWLIRISSSLFYIFNPIVHVAVLHRFQYPMVFFYGFLPFAFLIYYLGVKNKKLYYLIVLNLLTIIFSFIFVGIAFFELLFCVLGSLSFVLVIDSFLNRKLDLFPLFYFLFFIILFSFINIWWLLPFLVPFFSSGSSVALSFFDPSGNIQTFKIISSTLESILSVFRLFPINFYEGNGSIWGWIYYTFPFVILSFFFIFVFVISLFTKKRNLLFSYFICISLITMFLMKGSLQPFGEMSLLLMQFFSPLHVFRNSFEKIGLLLPFAMAIPVGIGISMILNFLTSKVKLNKKIVIFTFLLLIFPIYMFPIVNGFVFTGGGGKPADDISIGQYVKVPEYYKDANNFLNKNGSCSQQNCLSRVVVLPIDGEGMTYNWEYGYSGVELSNTLFDQSTISFTTGQLFLPQAIASINKTLKVFPKDFLYLAQIFNTRFVIIRDDIDYKYRETYSPKEVSEILDSELKNYFNKVTSYGKLSLYEIKPEYFTPRIYLNTTPTYSPSRPEEIFDLFHYKNFKNQDLILKVNESTTEFPLNNGVIIKGNIVENIQTTSAESLAQLPLIRFNRNNPFYKIVRVKEALDLMLLTGHNRIITRVNLLWKRLSEFKQATGNKEEAFDEYYQEFKSISDNYLKSGIISRDSMVALHYQMQVLENLRNENLQLRDKIELALLDLNNFLTKTGYKLIFPTQKQMVMRFNVLEDGQYDIVMAKENWASYYHPIDQIEFELDSKNIKVKIKEENHELNLGKYFLNKGAHEIGFDLPQNINLIDTNSKEIILSNQEKEILKTYFPFTKVDNYSLYEVSFDYFAEKGNTPFFSIDQDSDVLDKKGQRQPRVLSLLTKDYYDYGWKNFKTQFYLHPTTKEASVMFTLHPWGDCKSLVKRSQWKYCEDKEFNKRFLKNSSVTIKNLKMERVFTNSVILRSEKTAISNETLPQISFNQVSPARYYVKLNDVKQPFFMILSTAYNSQWKAYIMKNDPQSFFEKLSDSSRGEILSEKNHLISNGFSNAWYIDKLGTYDLFLEFYPERIYTIGKKISLVFFILYISIIILITIHKYLRRSKLKI